MSQLLLLPTRMVSTVANIMNGYYSLGYSTEITVEFQNINITTSEVAGSVKVCVLIAYGTLGRNLTIHLSTMGGEFFVFCPTYVGLPKCIKHLMLTQEQFA